jgi:hypothetical protein
MRYIIEHFWIKRLQILEFWLFRLIFIFILLQLFMMAVPENQFLHWVEVIFKQGLDSVLEELGHLILEYLDIWCLLGTALPWIDDKVEIVCHERPLVLLLTKVVYCKLLQEFDEYLLQLIQSNANHILRQIGQYLIDWSMEICKLCCWCMDYCLIVQLVILHLSFFDIINKGIE